MKKFYPLITLILTVAFTTSSLHAQETCYQEDVNYGSAYVESSHSANWTVYIPVTLIVGAAIWFGFADRSKDKKNCSDSQDGLGRMDSSKRISSSSYHKSNNYSSSSYRSKVTTFGSFSHNN